MQRQEASEGQGEVEAVPVGDDATMQGCWVRGSGVVLFGTNDAEYDDERRLLVELWGRAERAEAFLQETDRRLGCLGRRLEDLIVRRGRASSEDSFLNRRLQPPELDDGDELEARVTFCEQMVETVYEKLAPTRSLLQTSRNGFSVASFEAPSRRPGPGSISVKISSARSSRGGGDGECCAPAVVGAAACSRLRSDMCLRCVIKELPGDDLSEVCVLTPRADAHLRDSPNDELSELWQRTERADAYMRGLAARLTALTRRLQHLIGTASPESDAGGGASRESGSEDLEASLVASEIAVALLWDRLHTVAMNQPGRSAPLAKGAGTSSSLRTATASSGRMTSL